MRIRVGNRSYPLPKAGDRLNLFIAGLMLLPLYIKLMGILSQVLSFSTTITTYIYYGFLWLMLATAAEAFLLIWKKAALVIISLSIFTLIEVTLFPMSGQFLYGSTLTELVTFQPQTLMGSVLFILVGMAVRDHDGLIQAMHTAARIGVVMGALAYVISVFAGLKIHYDDMSTAYAVCFPVCVLIAKKEKNDIYFLAAGMMCLLVAGTRGPILCVIIAVLMKAVLLRQSTKKLLGEILVCVIVALALYSGFLTWLMEQVASIFSRAGIQNLRILNYINQGIFMDSSGRDNIASAVIDGIKQKPFWGYGIGGDRLLTGGRYVHNLILECLVSCGLWGGVFLAWMMWTAIRTLRSKSVSLQAITIAFFSAIIIKLMLSSSLIYSKELFLFLGICMSGRRCRGNGVPRTRAIMTNEK